MNDLGELYAKLSAVAPKANPADLDAYVARETGGKIKSFRELAQAVFPQRQQSSTPIAPQAVRGNDYRPTALMAAGEGLWDTATFGTGAKLEGAVAGAIPGGLDYRQARDRSRARLAGARATHPLATGAGELAGGFAVPGVAAATSGMSALKAGAAVGGAFGAASGAGHVDDGSVTQYLKSTGYGAVIGTAVGATLAKALESAVGLGIDLVDKQGKLTRKAKDVVNYILKQNGVTREQAAANLERMSADAPEAIRMVDVIPGAERQLHAAGDVSPRVANATRNEIRTRQADQASRVQGAFEAGFGTPEITAQSPSGPVTIPARPMTAADARAGRLAASGAVPKTSRALYEPLDKSMVTDPDVAHLLTHRDIAGHVPRDPAQLAGHVDPRDVLNPQAVVQKALQNLDGGSINPRTLAVNDVNSGGFVAVVSDKNPIPYMGEGVDPAAVQAEITRRVQYLMGKYGDEIANNPDLYIGLDSEGGKVGVELSRHFANPADAAAVGVRLKQNSVYDAGAGASVLTGGSRSEAINAPPTFFGPLQETLRNLRDEVTQSFQSGAGGRGKALAERARELNDAMEGALPGFQRANRTYGETVRLAGKAPEMTPGGLAHPELGSGQSAFDFGAQIITGGKSAADVADGAGRIVADLGQEGLQAVRMGAIEQLGRQLNTPISTANVANVYANMGAEMQAKLKVLFPSEESLQRFLQKMETERRLSVVNQNAQGGSRTNMAANDVTQMGEAVARGLLPGNVLAPVGTAGRSAINIFNRQMSEKAANATGDVLLADPERARMLLSGFNPAIRGMLGKFLGAGMTGGILGGQEQ